MKVIYRVNIFVRFSMVLLLLSSLNGGHDLSLYKAVQYNLSKYRQSISHNDFSFQNGIIRLKLNGRRTNIKSQILFGFYSVGMTLNRIDIQCREIEIVVSYDTKKKNQIAVRASAEEVMNLSQGRLSSEQFFILIGY